MLHNQNLQPKPKDVTTVEGAHLAIAHLAVAHLVAVDHPTSVNLIVALPTVALIVALNEAFPILGQDASAIWKQAKALFSNRETFLT